MRLRFERYFSPDDGRSISRNVASLNILVHDVIEINDTTIKDKRNEAIKNSDIRNLSEHEEQENCYKPVREGNFWSNN